MNEKPEEAQPQKRVETFGPDKPRPLGGTRTYADSAGSYTEAGTHVSDPKQAPAASPKAKNRRCHPRQ